MGLKRAMGCLVGCSSASVSNMGRGVVDVVVTKTATGGSKVVVGEKEAAAGWKKLEDSPRVGVKNSSPKLADPKRPELELEGNKLSPAVSLPLMLRSLMMASGSGTLGGWGGLGGTGG